MALKDMIKKHIDMVFFNEGHFADTMKVDGRDILVVCDNDALTKNTDLSLLAETPLECNIFVKAKDMARLPLANQEMNINGRKWYVVKAWNNIGIYQILLHQNTIYNRQDMN